MKRLQSVDLGKVASFVRGITFKPDDVTPIDTSGSIACMRTKNVQNLIDISDVWGIPREFTKRKEQYLQEGDILVSTANSWNLVGKCCWVPELPWEATFGGFISALRADRDSIDPRYLYHWFSSDRIQAQVRSCGRQTTNISNLSLERCLAIEIPLPPLAEQRRIAAILDHAEALRVKRREALEKAESLIWSLFLDKFGDPVTNPMGWPRVGLSDILLVPLRNGLSPSNSGAVNAKVLTLSAITGSSFKEDAWKEAPFQSSPPAEQRVQRSDLLICRGNGNLNLVGRGFFPSHDMLDTAFPDTMIAARVSTEMVSPRFLQAVWNGPSVRKQIEALARTTNGTFKVNQGVLETITLLNPPLLLQQEFARQVEAIDRLKASHQASLAKLDELFASLQHRAFRGELTGAGLEQAKAELAGASA